MENCVLLVEECAFLATSLVGKLFPMRVLEDTKRSRRPLEQTQR